MQHAQAGVGDIFSEFKNASAFLLRGTRHACMTNYLCVPLQSAGHPLRAHPSGVPMVCLGSAISDGGLTPATDTDFLLAACRGGSHLLSDISHEVLDWCTVRIVALLVIVKILQCSDTNKTKYVISD